MSQFAPLTYAASSPWSQSDWTGGAGTSISNQYSSLSNIAANISNQLLLSKQEKLTNTGFETDLTNWTANTTSFSDANFASFSGAASAWPLDDAANNSFARVINPAVATGREMVINGGFDTDTVWAKGTNCTISGGVGHYAATPVAQQLAQNNIPFVVGRAYTVTYTISNYAAGNIRFTFGGTLGATRNSNGTFTETVLNTISNLLAFPAVTSAFTGDIDNVSVKELNIPAYNATPSQLLNTDVWNNLGTGAWTALNSATLTAQTTTRHDGNSGTVLRVARGVVPPGGATQTVMTIGLAYRVYGWARSDGTSSPVVRHGTTTVFTGTTSTDWQPFDVVFVAASTDIQLNTLNGANTNYVEFDVTTVALDTGIRQDSNVVLNGSLENWVSSTVLNQWTASLNGTSTLNREPTVVHGGNFAMRMDIDASNNAVTVSQASALVIGKTYTVSFWAKGTTTNQKVDTDTGIWATSAITITTSWALYTVTGVTVTSAFSIKRGLSNASQSIYIDDISIVETSPLVAKPVNGVVLGSSSGASGHLTNAYTFDGTNDDVNVYSGTLNSTLNPSEGSIVIWAKVSGSGVWTDATVRYLNRFVVDASNLFQIQKGTAVNQLGFTYIAGGTTSQILTTSLGATTGWFQVVLTWSKSGDSVKAYINGAQVGSTQTGLGTWTGNLSSTGANIGASVPAGTNPWSGLINDVRLYSRALTSTEISNLYNGLTATRDTSIKLSGTASAKITGATDENGTFVQSVNVGDTNSYNLSANVYIDGSTPVDSTYATLWYNGSAVTTTYTSVDSGWYKLTGTVTGVISSVDAGVQVLAGRTVYVDDISLNNYPASGTLTSSIFDSEQQSNWGTLSYSLSLPANTTGSIKLRSGNQADLSDSNNFSTCSAISSGVTVGATTCAPNGTRYVQYLLTLGSSDLLNTPTFTSFSLPFNFAFTVNLDSPDNNSYTNDVRPTFQWEKTSAASGIGKYILEIDNPSSPIIVDNIPANRTTDLVTDKYVIHYDTSAISFYTKSSSSWGSGENDGKLRDGTINWKVTAVDNAGNMISANRTLYVDTSPPTLSDVKTSDSSKPTISGSVSDTSGIGSVNIKIEKPNIFGEYDLYSLATLNNVSTSFSFTPDTAFPFGTYRITVVIKDNAGNETSKVINVNIAGNTPFIKPTVTATPTLRPTPVPSLKLNIQPTLSPTTKPISIYISFPNFGKIFGQIFRSYVNLAVNLYKFNQGIGNNIAILYTNYSKFVLNVNNTTLAFIGGGINRIGSTYVNLAINLYKFNQETANNIAILYSDYSKFVLDTNNSALAFIGGGISRMGSTYNNLANSTNGSLRKFLVSTGNGVSNVSTSIASEIKYEGMTVQKSQLSFVKNTNHSIIRFRKNMSSLAFNTGEKLQDTSDTVGLAIIQFTYNFVREPTTISDVKVTAISSTSAKISWVTNQPATGKVNYGFDETYPLNVQMTKLSKTHEFVLTNLDPDTRYSFEVMSQGKNYVYDANREFKTSKK